jgi:hypothetical protein
MTELLPISGIKTVGPLPAVVQKITVFPEGTVENRLTPLLEKAQ